MKYSTVLIQGAMDIEVDYLIKQLQEVENKTIAGYEFSIGCINKTKIIVSKTLIGTINATIATAIGIMTFKPDLVINQGIAGAHKENIHTGDIIIGEKCCNINSYSMPQKEVGQGSNSLEWQPDKRAKEVKMARKELVSLLYNCISDNSTNTVYKGNLGSGDAFNREADRINWISCKFDTLCEDMESIGVYSTCKQFDIPCIGVRIISNNELTGESLDEEQATKLQELIINFLHKCIDENAEIK